MSGSSPLLRSRKSPDYSPHYSPRRILESPVRPKVLAPLFAGTVDIHVRITPVAAADNPQLGHNPSPGSAGSKQASPHLYLVPKNVAMLATTGRGRENLLKMVDPHPDWTLDDLRAALGERSSSRSSEELPPRVDETQGGGEKDDFQKPSKPFIMRLHDEVADFQRPSKPFIMKLGDSDDDSDDDDEDEGSEEKISSSDSEQEPPVIDRTTSGGVREFFSTSSGRVEAALYEADRLRLLRVQEELRQKRSQLESAFLEANEASAEKIALVVKEEESKCEMARRSDKHYQRTVAEQRDKHLSALQRDHEQRSLVEERKIKKEEETLRRENAAKEELERQRTAKIEAEKQAAAKAAEAARIRIANAQRAELEKKEAAAKAEEETKRAALELEKSQKASEGPIPRVSKEAAAAEENRKKKFQELVQASQHLLGDPALKNDLKKLDIQIFKIVGQLAATEEQLRTKSLALLEFLKNPGIHSFVVRTIAVKVVKQCENQIARVPSYAYLYARIVMNVCSQFPAVLDAILAELNGKCILTVPKFYSYNKKNFKDEKSYFKTLGFEEVDGKLETEEFYVSRMCAYVRLYAAITQMEGHNPHGISNAWAWCARLLNHLPANIYTANALLAFLETAGFRMHQAYPRPFIKLLQAVITTFVPLVKKQKDPNAARLLMDIDTYMMKQKFLNRPDDRISQGDYSSLIFHQS